MPPAFVPAVGKTHHRVPAARIAPGLCKPIALLRREEGAGNAGCTLHPRSRVPFAPNKRCTRAYRFSGGNPASPAQWFYGLFRALPGDRAFLPPSFAGLIPRSWRQRRGARTTRLRRPQMGRSSFGTSASTAAPPRASLTIAMRPSCRGGMAHTVLEFVFLEKRNIFRGRARQVLSDGQFFCPSGDSGPGIRRG